MGFDRRSTRGEMQEKPLEPIASVGGLGGGFATAPVWLRRTGSKPIFGADFRPRNRECGKLLGCGSELYVKRRYIPWLLFFSRSGPAVRQIPSSFRFSILRSHDDSPPFPKNVRLHSSFGRTERRWLHDRGALDRNCGHRDSDRVGDSCGDLGSKRVRTSVRDGFREVLGNRLGRIRDRSSGRCSARIREWFRSSGCERRVDRDTDRSDRRETMAAPIGPVPWS